MVAIERLGPEPDVLLPQQRGHGFICIAFNRTFAWCCLTGDRGGTSGRRMTCRSRPAPPVKDRNGLGMSARIPGDCQLTGQCADFGDPNGAAYVSRTLDAEIGSPWRKIEAFPRIEGDIQGGGTQPGPGHWKCRG